MSDQTRPGNESIADSVLAAIVTISADAIICVDESQRVIFFNEGAETIFGYGQSEILGQPLEVLIPQRFRKAHPAQVRAFGESGVRARRMGERGQIFGLKRNGEEFPAEAAISHLESGGRRVYSVVLRDVTERRRALEAQEFLATAGERLASSLGEQETFQTITRLAVSLLADASVVNSYRGAVFHAVSVSHIDPQRAAEIERSRAEHPIDATGNHPVAKVIRTGRTLTWNPGDQSTESASARAELTDIFTSPPSAGILTPLVARGVPLGVLSFYREKGSYDRNDLFLAEELARRAALAIDNARLYELVMTGVQARDDMIGIVSHDLRNPVNAIRMLTGVMLERRGRDSLSAEMLEHASIIRQAAEQMDGLIRDLLDVTRVEAGRLAVNTTRENAEELVSDALRTLAPVTAQKKIRLKLNAPDDLPDVLADRERVGQAFSNLIGNAVKFSDENGEITVRVAVLESELVISISDTGKGMTTDQLTHAFDRFWQSSRTDRHGAGLGLAITKGIVEAHGGRIWAESSPGSGSTFYFTLPIF